ncbi:MAG: 4Fe-4S binding protein [Acidobacteria bacterium]|nr:4Fe-4S binding protein [Acidobacteriota bacterium]
MTWFASLSRAQRLWFALTLLAAVAIIGAGWVLEPGAADLPEAAFTVDLPIREIAPELGVTGMALARELGLPVDAPKGKSLKSLGIGQEELDEVVDHLAGHRPSRLRYFVYVALVLWGIVFLWRLGRPDGSPVERRGGWYPRLPYILTLVAAGIASGFALGKSPNPMEGFVKLPKAMAGLYPSVAVEAAGLLFFLVLAVVGNKLVCGWACPFGALQELVYSLPLLRRLKRKKVPFVWSNSVRALFFVLALLLLFGVIGRSKGFVLYHSLNPFNLFNLDFSPVSVTVTILLALGLSLFLYRPFCQFLCPFGLVSWLAERFSLARVRIDRDRCDKCGACVAACPLEAAAGRVEGKPFPADCYSCARCLKACPRDAIVWGWPRRAETGREDAALNAGKP